jgi:hypothetical protein
MSILREQNSCTPFALKKALLTIGHRCAALPNYDNRPVDDIFDYDQYGLPK